MFNWQKKGSIKRYFRLLYSANEVGLFWILKIKIFSGQRSTEKSRTNIEVEHENEMVQKFLNRIFDLLHNLFLKRNSTIWN